MAHTNVHMLARVDGTYRRVSRSQLPDWAILEGVDGDEDANTVTYYYRRPVDGEDR